MATPRAGSANFVRLAMLPPQVPPLRDKGAVKWVRENLFSSWLNAILTLLSLYVVFSIVAGLLPWLANSVWNAGSLTECREVLAAHAVDGHGGACWAVIRDRWVQLLFGFYPTELAWRPILSLVLLFVALVPVLFPGLVSARFYWLSVLFPFAMPWLLWGGSFWVPLLVLGGFVAGALVYQVLGRLAGALSGVIGAILAAVLWWLMAMPALNDGLHHYFGAARLDSELVALSARLEALPAEIAAIEADMAVREAAIAAEVATKTDLLAAIAQRRADGASGPDLDAALAEFDGHMRSLTVQRQELSALSLRALKLEEETSAAQTLRRNIGLVEQQEAALPGLRDAAAVLRAALPESVAGLSPKQAETSAAPREDLTALAAVFRAEDAVSNAEKLISATYHDVGRIGLTPVKSSDFGGFQLSLLIGVSGIMLSLPLGVLLALGRQSNLFIINKVSVGFIEVIRGVPLIVWLFTAQLLLNYFLPPGTNFDLVLRVIIMVTLFSSAYIAEVVRGGLASLPKGQYEAADALGLDYWRAMRLIVLPQALKVSIPGIVNSFIGLFKDTTLVVFIGLLDPVGLLTSIRASTDWNGVRWELFLFVGIMFFVFCFSMGRYSLYLERKLAREHR